MQKWMRYLVNDMMLIQLLPGVGGGGQMLEPLVQVHSKQKSSENGPNDLTKSKNKRQKSDSNEAGLLLSFLKEREEQRV